MKQKFSFTAHTDLITSTKFMSANKQVLTASLDGRKENVHKKQKDFVKVVITIDVASGGEEWRQLGIPNRGAGTPHLHRRRSSSSSTWRRLAISRVC